MVLALALALGGLHGVVMRGPTAPVCRVGVPCERPAVGVVLTFAHARTVVARVRTDTRGRYALRLAPGTYTVGVLPSPTIGAGIRPGTVRVPPGLPARVDFLLDTGIR
jgi:hypothetical protein